MNSQFVLNPISDLQSLFTYPFMQHAMVAGSIVAVMAGVLGWLVVLRNETYAGHTLSIIGFPGAAGAILLGIAPLWGLLGFCVLGALGIYLLTSNKKGQRVGESAAIGSIQAMALVSGFLFVSLYGGFLNGVGDRLFGNVVGITFSDVEILFCSALVTLFAISFIGRPLLFASIDPAVAAGKTIPVQKLNIIFLITLGLAVAEVSQITGSLLAFALLVTPAAAAQQLTAKVSTGLFLAVIFALLVTWLGLAAAYFTSYPVGFLVSTLAFGIYILGRTIRVVRRA